MGSELLVKPVVAENQDTTRVYLPGANTVWYDYITSKVQLKYEMIKGNESKRGGKKGSE